jgi:hypothetical protein
LIVEREGNVSPLIFPSILDVPNIRVLKDGHQVSRISDFIIYSVEAEFISQVVSTYGPCKPSISATGMLSFSEC